MLRKSRNPLGSPGQIELLNLFRETNPVLLISTNDPREVSALRMELPAVFTYSTEAAVLKALAAVLAGNASPQGRIPVSR